MSFAKVSGADEMSNRNFNPRTFELKPGDMVIIPAGTGHWFSSIDGAIDYEVMRVDPGKLLSLK
jgi:mannose-6-phosphate isomerase-like protein (cupin superfamily)